MFRFLITFKDKNKTYLNHPLSGLKTLSFQIKIMEKNQPLFFSLLGSVSQKVQLRFSFTCSTNQNKRNQMSQVFIYFNHSYVLSIQSYLPKIKRGPSVFISKHLTYQRIERLITCHYLLMVVYQSILKSKPLYCFI